VVDKAALGGFCLSTSVFPTNHSTDCSTLIIVVIIIIHHHLGLTQ
jgi:hypothetical protein